jgi:hypothetical protein
MDKLRTSIAIVCQLRSVEGYTSMLVQQPCRIAIKSVSFTFHTKRAGTRTGSNHQPGGNPVSRYSIRFVAARTVGSRPHGETDVNLRSKTPIVIGGGLLFAFPSNGIGCFYVARILALATRTIRRCLHERLTAYHGETLRELVFSALVVPKDSDPDISIARAAARRSSTSASRCTALLAYGWTSPAYRNFSCAPTGA